MALATAGILALFLFFGNVDPVTEPRKNSVSALRTVRKFVRAEYDFHQHHQRYGSLSELRDLLGAGLPFDADKVPVNGYRFHLDAARNTYTLTAQPVVYGQTGSQSFYADQTGDIHESWSKEPATKDSPIAERSLLLLVL